MGILDFFKRKPVKLTDNSVNLSQKTKSNDNLAELLEKAEKETNLRPLFFKTLLSSELIVLTNQADRESGVKVLEEDTKIKIVTFENGTIPIFSSTDRLFDNGIIKTEVPFIGMSGKNLLNTTKGAVLILNPFSNIKKEFQPSEIESLLSGELFEPQINIAKKDTRIRMGQPANLSDELVKNIRAYCKLRPEIITAYIALIHRIDEEELPHLLVAIKILSNEMEIFGEIGEVVKPHLKKQEIIDFMPLADDGLSSYFKTIEPIYRKGE